MMYSPEEYPLVVYWSREDGCFLVEVPDLPGCLADGATQTEAVANAQVIIAEWLETAQELRRPIPAPRPRLRIAS